LASLIIPPLTTYWFAEMTAASNGFGTCSLSQLPNQNFSDHERQKRLPVFRAKRTGPIFTVSWACGPSTVNAAETLFHHADIPQRPPTRRGSTNLYNPETKPLDAACSIFAIGLCEESTLSDDPGKIRAG
jgi:hypothetical protein